MRIAEIISGQELNGVPVNLVRLTRQLVARGHEVTVVCRPGSWVERQLHSVAHVVTSDLHRWPPTELRRVATVLADRRCDVVHTHMSRAHLFGVLLKGLLTAPVVASAHSRLIQPHWMLNDHVIAVSAAVGDFQRRYNLVRRRRLSVVHNFVDVAEFETTAAERARARAELGIDESCMLFGKVGNVFREKGVHHLIEAMPSVIARAPHSLLLVRGRGPEDYRRTLIARARELGIAANIVWAPEVAPELIMRTYAALDVLVVPSLEEPLSTVCLEGMAAGLPIVATRVGGHPELIDEGCTGLLVPASSPRALADAMVALATDRAWRLRLGAAGRARARRAFSPQRQVEQIENVFAFVAGRNKSADAHACMEAEAHSVFDRTLAEFPTRVLPCGEVVDLLPLSHAPERIALYREQMQRGDRFPPVSVIRLGGRYLVADGHKRFAAYQALGHPQILVEIWPLRRWLRDQGLQAVGNARKNARIVATSFSDPPAAGRLVLTTLLHWRRVARSLAARAAGRVR